MSYEPEITPAQCSIHHLDAQGQALAAVMGMRAGRRVSRADTGGGRRHPSMARRHPHVCA
eukprot:2316869-Prymnesium_polylepis.1